MQDPGGERKQATESLSVIYLDWHHFRRQVINWANAG